MDKESILVLKTIAKELHEMNKKLDSFGQASIFNRNSGVYVTEEMLNGYIFECDEQSNEIHSRK